MTIKNKYVKTYIERCQIDGYIHHLIYNMRKNKEKLKEKIGFALSSMGEKFSLKRLDIVTKNKTNLVKVFVERPGGITIDDCVDISEKLSVHLEILDLLPGSYRLEVSSPGAENKEER